MRSPRRLAGHSRWQNVKADKDAGRIQKSMTMTGMLKQVRKALLDGNGNTNPQTNVHLKAVFDKARSENVPLKSLEKMVAARSQAGVEPYVIEVRGRGGICVLVQSDSPARIKCRQEVSSHVKKIGLEVVGVDSQVSRSFFSKKGRIEAMRDPAKLPSLDQATELALEFDCSDVRLEGGDDVGGASFVFECDPMNVSAVAESLRTSGVDVIDYGAYYDPLEKVEIDGDTDALLRSTYDKIKDSVDGVLEVFDNVTTSGR